MKFLCSHCKAKYQIADEKVAGRTLRMTCRKCGEEILIRGDAATRPPSSRPPKAPSPAGLAAPPPAAGAPVLQRELERALSSAPAPAAAPPALGVWHVAIDSTPVGPISRDEVARRMAAGEVGPATLAWREGMGDWHAVRDVPELAALLPSRTPLPPVLPHHQQPTAQHPTAPAAQQPPAPTLQHPPAALGGRAGAGVAPSFDDWGGPPYETSPSQVTPHPLAQSAATPAPAAVSAPEADESRRSPPSYAVMFALAGFVAFIMTATTLVGVKLLKDEPAAAPTPPAQPGPVTQKPSQPELELPEDPEPEAEGAEGADEETVMVIGLDDLPEEEPDPGQTSRPRRKSSGSKQGSGSKKQLTAAEKAMLERMGGGSSSDLPSLNGVGGDSNRKRAGSGSISAAQLSSIVGRGKRNLQRCYETAMRSSGTAETVRVDVTVSVSAAGNVKSVKTTGKGLPGLSQCIQRSVKTWRFPSTGEDFQTKFPLVFSPGG
jgi:predicted Zn finger-like uncharacterized protein